MSELTLVGSGVTVNIGVHTGDPGINTEGPNTARITALEEGSDFGNPVSVRRQLRSLRDGSVMVRDRSENREATLRVRVEGATTLGERLLMRALAGQAELTWDAPSTEGSAAVFKIVAGDVDQELDGPRDATQRIYLLRLEALPFVLSPTATTVAAAAAGTYPGRSHVRTVSVGGSARAEASVHVASRSSGLGDVIVYSGPADPRMSAPGTVRTPAPTASGSYLSGGYSQGTAGTFRRPLGEFPSGTYTVFVVAAPTTTTDVELEVTTGITTSGGAAVADLAEETRVVTGWTADQQRLLVAGTVHVPAMGAGSTHHLSVSLDASTTMRYDEVLLFHEDGDLDIVHAGSATGLWVDAWTPERDERIMLGASVAASRPAFLASEVEAWDGGHAFTPGPLTLYVGAGVADPADTWTYRRAWLANPET